MREVLTEPFALTLWTWGELRAIAREASVERMGERTDLAGLVAVGFHDPKGLEKADFRYLKAAGQLKTMFTGARERAEKMMRDLERAQAAQRPEA
jgi:hypothetical protein